MRRRGFPAPPMTVAGTTIPLALGFAGFGVGAVQCGIVIGDVVGLVQRVERDAVGGVLAVLGGYAAGGLFSGSAVSVASIALALEFAGFGGGEAFGVAVLGV